MKKLKNLFATLTNERGHSLIIIAVSLVAILGLSALVVDMGYAYLARADTQSAVDAAALAGAQELPNSAAAQAAALLYARENGMQDEELTITTPYSGDANKIEVVGARTIQYTFARVLGVDSGAVTARAVAQKSGRASGAFDYALFSGSPQDTLSLNGSSFYLAGGVHSNKNLSLNGSSMQILGNFQAVDTVTVNGSSLNITGECIGNSIVVYGSDIKINKKVFEPAPQFDMPDLSAEVIAQAEKNGNVYTGNKDFSGTNFVVDGSLYVKGNITMNCSSFKGTGCILATGNIQFNGSGLKNDAGDAVCFYSLNGNITVNSSSQELLGIIYAPNGTVTFNGSAQNIKGRVIAKQIRINTGSLRIVAGTEEFAALPMGSQTIGLVE